MLEIDGSYLEGGGQILRTATGLAAATGTPCRITEVRKGRRRPGLAPQHLCGVRAVARLCGAELEGAEVGSTELTFLPGPIEPPERLSAEVGTAGSVTLVLQGLMIPLAGQDRTVEVTVGGGTHVKWSPTADYFERVFCPLLGQMGCRAEVGQVEPGFYPQGGGRVTLTVTGGELEPLALTEPEGEPRLRALSIATADLAKARVPERQLEGACERAEFDEAVFHYVASPSTGTAVLLTAEYGNCRLGASSLGERGRPAEKVGRQAWRALERAMRSGACLDEQMADQALPYLALAGGESRVRVAGITDHCRTNAYVIEQFLPVRFELDEGRRLISCAPAPPSD